MNMLLHGLSDARIEKGDTIRDPKLKTGGELSLFDRVIANPPFSLDEWGRDIAEQDPYGRFRFGVPPKTKGDLAFVQHMIATTNMSGMVGVVMPHGVLFRGAAEGDKRKHRVSFEEAMTAFLDPLARIFDDPDQAHGEQRFLLVGVSATSHLLVVVHVERGDSLRIVSARLATKRERFNLETES